MEGIDLTKLSMEEKMNLLLNNVVMKQDMKALETTLSTKMEEISTQLNEKLDDVQAQIDDVDKRQKLDSATLAATIKDVAVLQDDAVEIRKYIADSKIRDTNQAVHNRRYNLIFGNLDDVRAWESQGSSIVKVRTFLNNLKEAEFANAEGHVSDWNPDAIVIKEAHRLPQDPAKIHPPRRGVKRSTNRPMVIKFECMTDISMILSKCKYLRFMNEGRLAHERFFVDRHYPKEVQLQKQSLKGKFNKLKAEGKKPVYKYDITTASMIVTAKD